MLSSRIVAGACALSLAVPAAAAAQPYRDAPIGHLRHTTTHVVYGDSNYDRQNQADLKAPIAPVAVAHHAVPATAVEDSPATTDDGTQGWRIAALGEAALLAAFAVGSVVLLRGRRRAPLGV
jgi:hypothetical protein